MADIQEVAFNSTVTNVTVVTTTETALITTPAIAVVRQTMRAIVIANAQLQTGADTTTVAKLIRRGDSVSGTLVGEAQPEQVTAVAGSVQQLITMVSEEISNLGSVQYTFSVDQADATGNGTVTQAAILVLLV